MVTKKEVKLVDLIESDEIDKNTIDKLKSAGKFTLKSIQRTTQKQLSKIGGLSVEKVKLIHAAVNKLCDNSVIVSGDQITDESFAISTGVKSIDELLGGGIRSMRITEAFGKCPELLALLSHTLLVTSQLVENADKSDGRAVFIDVGGTYNPVPIEIIAERMGIQNGNNALRNISHFPVNGKEQLLELLDNFPRILYEAKGGYNVIVINEFSVLFSGKKEKKFKEEILLKLQALSEDFNCAVVVTNRMMMRDITVVRPPMVRFAIKPSGADWEVQLQNESLEFEREAPFTVTSYGFADIPI